MPRSVRSFPIARDRGGEHITGNPLTLPRHPMTETTVFTKSQAEKDGAALVQVIEREGHKGLSAKLSKDVQNDLLNTAQQLDTTGDSYKQARAHFDDILTKVNSEMASDVRMVGPISYTDHETAPKLWGFNFNRTQVPATAEAEVFLDLDSGQLFDQSGGVYHCQMKSGKISFIKDAHAHKTNSKNK